jgi:hypothetical protein
MVYGRVHNLFIEGLYVDTRRDAQSRYVPGSVGGEESNAGANYLESEGKPACGEVERKDFWRCV